MAAFGRLNRRQRRFVAAMLSARTVKAAAEAAGIGERTAYNYLAHDAVRAELSRRQDEAVTLAAANLATASGEAMAVLREALAVLEDQAAGDIGDFIQVGDGGRWLIDVAAAEKAGKLHLVKRLWADRYGDRLELHDAQAAAFRLGKLALDILGERRKTAELDDLARRVAALEERIEALRK